MTLDDAMPLSQCGADIIHLLDNAESGLDEPWSVDDLREMWLHQLDGPIHFEWSAGKSVGQASQSVPPPSSLRDLFESDTPDLDTLRSVKAQAKLIGEKRDSPIPPVIIKAVYYVSIVVAFEKRGEMITSFSPDALRKNLAWLEDQPWLDGFTCDTLNSAMVSLHTES